MKKVKLVPTLEFQGVYYTSTVSLFRLKEGIRAAISVLQTIEVSKDLDLVEDDSVLRLNCLENDGELLSFGPDDFTELQQLLSELETLPNDPE